jgi:hypothetical protein
VPTKSDRKKNVGRYNVINKRIILKLILQLKQLEGVKWIEVALKRYSGRLLYHVINPYPANVENMVSS